MSDFKFGVAFTVWPFVSMTAVNSLTGELTSWPAINGAGWLIIGLCYGLSNHLAAKRRWRDYQASLTPQDRADFAAYTAELSARRATHMQTEAYKKYTRP